MVTKLFSAQERITCSKSRGGMGFRDLKAFNSAMLAKQWWNIMNNLDSLVARLLKAMYFPHLAFLVSNLDHNHSYSWHSIWSSCHIHVHGCRWRIRDGSKIRVMKDPWLQVEGLAWMQAPQPHGVYDMVVSDLMVSWERRWDVVKIQNLFSPHVAQNILSVSLNPNVEVDTLM